jgi:hypothetical protein
MRSDPEGTSGFGLDPSALEPGEIVLQRWSAPGGHGLLTSRRCLLLGHPHPFRRSVEWSEALEEVLVIETEQDAASPGMAGLSGEGGSYPTRPLSGSFRLTVDNVSVYVGLPQECEKIQAWIEEARTARLAELGNRVLARGPSEAPPNSTRIEP